MQMSTEKLIYFITGASGVGKTTLLGHFKEKYGEMPWAFVHFDSMGVPSIGETERDFGSATEWQKASAFKCIDKVVNEYDQEKVFIEGQVNLEFIRDGFAKQNFKSYKIVLIHCEEEEMSYRLNYKRRQPELFNKHMRNWLRFLKGQAEETATPIIDTSNSSEEEVLAKFEDLIKIS